MPAENQCSDETQAHRNRTTIDKIVECCEQLKYQILEINNKSKTDGPNTSLRKIRHHLASIERQEISEASSTWNRLFDETEEISFECQTKDASAISESEVAHLQSKFSNANYKYDMFAFNKDKLGQTDTADCRIAIAAEQYLGNADKRKYHSFSKRLKRYYTILLLAAVCVLFIVGFGILLKKMSSLNNTVVELVDKVNIVINDNDSPRDFTTETADFSATYATDENSFEMDQTTEEPLSTLKGSRRIRNIYLDIYEYVIDVEEFEQSIDYIG